MKKVRVRWPRFCTACSVGDSAAALKINHSSSRSSSDDSEARRPFSSSGGGGVSSGHAAASGDGGGSKVMVVVDSSLEAKGALEWALSHTVQSQDDTIVLLHVAKPLKGERRRQIDGRARELLQSMKSMCQKKRPGVQVQVAVREGKDNKGPIIVEEAKRRRVSLLVIGQRKRSMMWWLTRQWSRRRLHRGGAVEYCIENANCMTVGVRRKSKSLGGYLITTKRHKNFWLLA